MKWQETALEIAKEAFDEYKNDEEEAIDFIWESADGCENVIYTAEAYETVSDARVTDYETFEAANIELIEIGSDHIGKGETIDNLITRLAFLIVNRKAIDYYYSILKEKEEEEEQEMAKSWTETAKNIGYDAWLELGDMIDNDEEQIREYIYDAVENCHEISHTTTAREVVFDAADSDWGTWDRAHDELVSNGGDRINLQKNENIDDVINRLAFLIIAIKAFDYYEHFAITKEGRGEELEKEQQS